MIKNKNLSMMDNFPLSLFSRMNTSSMNIGIALIGWIKNVAIKKTINVLNEIDLSCRYIKVKNIVIRPLENT